MNCIQPDAATKQLEKKDRKDVYAHYVIVAPLPFIQIEQGLPVNYINCRKYVPQKPRIQLEPVI